MVIRSIFIHRGYSYGCMLQHLCTSSCINSRCKTIAIYPMYSLVLSSWIQRRSCSNVSSAPSIEDTTTVSSSMESSAAVELNNAVDEDKRKRILHQSSSKLSSMGRRRRSMSYINGESHSRIDPRNFVDHLQRCMSVASSMIDSYNNIDVNNDEYNSGIYDDGPDVTTVDDKDEHDIISNNEYTSNNDNDVSSKTKEGFDGSFIEDSLEEEQKERVVQSIQERRCSAARLLLCNMTSHLSVVNFDAPIPSSLHTRMTALYRGSRVRNALQDMCSLTGAILHDCQRGTDGNIPGITVPLAVIPSALYILATAPRVVLNEAVNAGLVEALLSRMEFAATSRPCRRNGDLLTDAQLLQQDEIDRLATWSLCAASLLYRNVTMARGPHYREMLNSNKSFEDTDRGDWSRRADSIEAARSIRERLASATANRIIERMAEWHASPDGGASPQRVMYACLSLAGTGIDLPVVNMAVRLLPAYMLEQDAVAFQYSSPDVIVGLARSVIYRADILDANDISMVAAAVSQHLLSLDSSALSQSVMVDYMWSLALAKCYTGDHKRLFKKFINHLGEMNEPEIPGEMYGEWLNISERNADTLRRIRYALGVEGPPGLVSNMFSTRLKARLDRLPLLLPGDADRPRSLESLGVARCIRLMNLAVQPALLLNGAIYVDAFVPNPYLAENPDHMLSKLPDDTRANTYALFGSPSAPFGAWRGIAVLIVGNESQRRSVDSAPPAIPLPLKVDHLGWGLSGTSYLVYLMRTAKVYRSPISLPEVSDNVSLLPRVTRVTEMLEAAAVKVVVLHLDSGLFTITRKKDLGVNNGFPVERVEATHELPVYHYIRRTLMGLHANFPWLPPRHRGRKASLERNLLKEVDVGRLDRNEPPVSLPHVSPDAALVTQDAWWWQPSFASMEDELMVLGTSRIT